ncbi:MAG: Transposase [Syntrophus sp. PtaB.Bin075]|nr:MAG: Transposase [Syntrophus sp. PtaB.Bin075]
MAVRERTKYQGVYRRESSDRTFKGKPDICFDVSYKADGKKVWEKVGWLSEGYSEKLAADILAERKRSIRHGEELPKQKQKEPFFHDLADKYFKWAKTNLTKDGKFELNRYDLHLKDFFNNKRMDQISSFDLERLKAELGKKGLSPMSTKHVLVLFRSIVNKAIAWGLYKGANPVKGIKMPVPQNARQRFLSPEEADRLLNNLKERSLLWHDIALLSLHTGMRASEIFHLKNHDFNFNDGTIFISNPKNKHSRYAYMTSAVEDMLKKRVEDDKPDAFIFLNRKGEQITEVSRSFERAVEALQFNKGIQDARQKVVFHTLRHTFCSWLAIQGVPLYTIGELAGHREILLWFNENGHHDKLEK